MVIGEIIQRIQSLYSKGASSDDVRLSERQIFSNILTARSKLLRQKSNKNQYVGDWNYQTLYVPLDLVSRSIPEIDDKILSSGTIPVILSNLNGPIIRSVLSSNGAIEFSRTTQYEGKYRHANKYTAKKIDYYFKDDKVFLNSALGPKSIKISAIFENPVSVMIYNNPNIWQDYRELSFPMDDDTIDTMTTMLISQLLSPMSVAKEDFYNDGLDVTASVSSSALQQQQQQRR